MFQQLIDFHRNILKANSPVVKDITNRKIHIIKQTYREDKQQLNKIIDNIKHEFIEFAQYEGRPIVDAKERRNTQDVEQSN